MSRRSAISAALLFLVAGIFVSCAQINQPPLTAPPPPTPHILRLDLTTAVMRWKEARLPACAAAQPQTGLIIREIPAAGSLAVEAPLPGVTPTGETTPRVGTGSPSGDVLLRFGPPAELSAYSAVIAYDQVVLITHPSNQLSRLTPQAVILAYTGKAATWGDLQLPGLGSSDLAKTAIQAWTYPEGDDVRRVFDLAFLGVQTPGKGLYVAPNAAAMLEAIAGTPGAIGYVLKSELDSPPPAGTPVPAIQRPNFPDAPGALRQPVLAVAPAEPQGDLRQLLLCLQK